MCDVCEEWRLSEVCLRLVFSALTHVACQKLFIMLVIFMGNDHSSRINRMGTRYTYSRDEREEGYFSQMVAGGAETVVSDLLSLQGCFFLQSSCLV